MQNDAAGLARAEICMIDGPKCGAIENQIHFFGSVAMPWVVKSGSLNHQSDPKFMIVEHAIRANQLHNGQVILRSLRQFAEPGLAPMEIPCTGLKKACQLILRMAKHVGQDRAGGHLSWR